VILPFVDSLTNHVWQIIEFGWLPVTDYVASQATSVSLGRIHAGTLAATYFLPSTSLGTALIKAGVLSANLFPTTVSGQSPNNSRVTGADVMVGAWTQNASQSGTGRFVVRLRPGQVTRESPKRPTAAQSTV
jgi:hypothetical protein